MEGGNRDSGSPRQMKIRKLFDSSDSSDFDEFVEKKIRELKEVEEGQEDFLGKSERLGKGRNEYIDNINDLFQLTEMETKDMVGDIMLTMGHASVLADMLDDCLETIKENEHVLDPIEANPEISTTSWVKNLKSDFLRSEDSRTEKLAKIRQNILSAVEDICEVKVRGTSRKDRADRPGPSWELSSSSSTEETSYDSNVEQVETIRQSTDTHSEEMQSVAAMHTAAKNTSESD